jgi:hypothetical protein
MQVQVHDGKALPLPVDALDLAAHISDDLQMALQCALPFSPG